MQTDTTLFPSATLSSLLHSVSFLLHPLSNLPSPFILFLYNNPSTPHSIPSFPLPSTAFFPLSSTTLPFPTLYPLLHSPSPPSPPSLASKHTQTCIPSSRRRRLHSAPKWAILITRQHGDLSTRPHDPWRKKTPSPHSMSSCDASKAKVSPPSFRTPQNNKD